MSEGRINRNQSPDGSGDPASPRWTQDLAILDLVHESIYARDRERKITFWNAAAEELYGWSREEALGRDVVELLSCDYHLTVDECEAQLFESGLWRAELRRKDRTGADILVDVTWAVRRDALGEPIEIIETGRNITDRRKQEADRVLSELRFRNLFDVMAVAFWEIDFNNVGARLIPLMQDGGGDELRSRLLEDRPFVRELMRNATVLDVNAKTLDLFGGECRDQMVGHDIDRYWPEESEPVFVEALVAAMERRSNLITETKLLDLKGQSIDVLFTVSWSPESRKQGIVLLGLIDISDRKRAFEALAQSELRYRSIFNSMPMAFWQFDTQALRTQFDRLRQEGVVSLMDYAAADPEFASKAMGLVQVVDVNDETVRMMGARSKSDLIGPLSKLWSDSDSFVQSVDARFKGAQSFGDISTMKTLDGRTIDVMWRTVFADELADTGLVLTGAIDVTERRRAVEEMSRSETKYRHLFHHMPTSLWQLDSRPLLKELGKLVAAGMTDLDAYIAEHPEFLGRAMEIITVEEVNDLTVRLFGGTDKSDFVGPISRFWIDSPDTIRRSLCARFRGEESHQEETRVRTLDGRTIDILFTSAFPPALADLGITIVSAIDIGDRIGAEHALARLQAEFAHAARVATLGELTASIAHEVNQPLAAIAANGDASLRWLNRDEPDVDEVRKLAARMAADARRAADVISRIRGMASHQPPKQDLVDLNSVVEEACQFLRHDLEAHGITTSLALVRGLPPVLSDRTQLQQVVVNLAVNAGHAMRQQSDRRRQLTLRSFVRNGRVRCEVEDTGPGIPDEIRQRLFDSFFTTKEEGLGIGLSICRSIIEAHGGEIGCDEMPAGARFYFELPGAG